MACPSDSIRVPHDPASLAEALRASGALEYCGIEVSSDRLLLLFPESDFAVRTGSTHKPGEMRLIFSVAVRAPDPSLETWWDKWSVYIDRRDPVAVVLSEIRVCRDRYLRMLDERFGCLIDK